MDRAFYGDAMSILIPIAAYGPYIASFIEAQGVADPTSVMIRSIGFNFYCILAVVGVAVFTLLHIEYGPMKKAEEAYMNAADADADALNGEVEHPGTGKARYLVVSLAIMIGFALVYFLTAGDSETGLILGIFFGSLYLMLDLAIHKVMKFGETLDVFFQGCGSMTGIVAIMVFAYALSNLLGELGTAEFLSGVLVQLISPTVFTALAFIGHLPAFLLYGNQRGKHRDYDAGAAAHGTDAERAGGADYRSHRRRRGIWRSHFSDFRYDGYDLLFL